jgi:hypothetical protein
MSNIADPIDLKLDPATEDLVVTDDVVMVAGPDAVGQLLRVRLKMFAGEWFANLNAYVDYYGEVLGQKFSPERIRAAFRPTIVTTPGVAEVLALIAVFDGPTRGLTLTYRVRTAFDDTVEDTLAVNA